MNKENEYLLRKFISGLEKSNRSAHTLVNYQSDLSRFLEWYELTSDARLHKANTQTIELYQQHLMSGEISAPKKSIALRIFSLFSALFHFALKKKKYGVLQAHHKSSKALSTASRKRHLSTIKNFFDFLQEIHADHGRKYAINPVKPKIHAIRLKDSDISHTKMLGLEDWEKIKEAAWRTHERLMIKILYYGGLRLSELTHLRYEDFNETKRSLIFVRKGGSRHELFIQNFEDIYKDVLFLKRTASSPYLFTGKSGAALTTRAMSMRIMSLLKRAKASEGLGPHSFRKACATNLYRKSKDLLLVRDYLNHSDAKVTQTYIDKELLRRDMFLLGTL